MNSLNIKLNYTDHSPPQYREKNFIKTKTQKKVSPLPNISFGSAGKITTQSVLSKRAGFFIEKSVGQNATNLINYGSKALITPFMILLASKKTDEPKSAIKTSMIMQPLQAVIAFISSLGIGMAANTLLDKSAKKGNLGNFIDSRLGGFFQKPTHLKELKNISTAVMTVIAIPLTSKIMTKLLPKLTKKSDKPDVNIQKHTNIYAKSIQPSYATSLKPDLGFLSYKNSIKPLKLGSQNDKNF